MSHASIPYRVPTNKRLQRILDRLKHIGTNGTGYSARQAGFALPAGGKTGSTDDHSDAWFIGFTPKLAAGVWVGYDQPQPIGRRAFASVVAVPAWARFMKQAVHDEKGEWVQRPAGISQIRRCKATGGLATEYCELSGEAVNDMVSIGRAPELCSLHNSTTLTSPMTTPAAVSIRPWP